MLFNLAEELKRTALSSLEEDHAKEDITTLSCLSSSLQIEASILLKQKAKISGLPLVPTLFHALDPSIDIALLAEEGLEYPEGTTLATLRGSASSILAAERTALNLLQHLCGIATHTSELVQEVAGYPCDILDTRKTLPGLRALQKYAVRIGGGKNHRFHLADRFLIKTTHLSLLRRECSRPVLEAVKRARKTKPGARIEVEVDSLEMLAEALECGAQHILLDNMDLPLVEEAVKRTQKRAYLEASGGMRKGKLRPFAATGIDGISIGALTHSVSAIDMSLRV